MISLVLTAALAAAPPPAGADAILRLDLTRHAVRGRETAPVLLIEFSDFKCHACERFSATVAPELEREYIDTGRLKMVFVDFPLIEEDHYTIVAEAAWCAGARGKYWPMVDTLWAHVGALGEPNLIDYAAGLGLDRAEFAGCLKSDRFRPRVLEGLAFANSLGLGSRPTFFIGRRDAASGPTAWRGRYIVGTQSYLIYRAQISRLLQETSGR